MTPEQENFDALRRLLKVKRYEQPPPGYFNSFSREVIACIKADVNAKPESLFDRLAWEAPWLRRLLDALQGKPALGMGLGVAACALLVGAVIYSENLDYKPIGSVALVPQAEQPAAMPPAEAVASAFGLKVPAEMAMATPGSSNSLTPIVPIRGSLFDQLQPIQPVLTSGRPPGQ